MKKNFNQIVSLVEQDAKLNGATVSLHLNKLTEEVGEFAQVINKTLGIKTKKKYDTPEAIKDNIAEEGADMIQIIVGICHLHSITYDQLMEKLTDKNHEYQKFIDDKSS